MLQREARGVTFSRAEDRVEQGDITGVVAGSERGECSGSVECTVAPA